MDIKIVRDKISKEELRQMAQEWGAELVKAVVDVERGMMAVGGEMHADEETVLLNDGSKQDHLWGINFLVEREGEGWIEFDSMINLRPRQGNRTRSVENPETRRGIIEIVNRLVK